jgi:allantoin racemase
MISTLACMLGRRFGVITVADGVVGPIQRIAAHAGLDDRLLGVAVVDTPVLTLHENLKETAARASTAGGKLVRQGATVLVLGCMSMAFLDLGPALEAKLGVPVANPVHAALIAAEGRARFRMRHSKAAYPSPRKLASGSRLSSLLAGPEPSGWWGHSVVTTAGLAQAFSDPSGQETPTKISQWLRSLLPWVWT